MTVEGRHVDVLCERGGQLLTQHRAGTFQPGGVIDQAAEPVVSPSGTLPEDLTRGA